MWDFSSLLLSPFDFGFWPEQLFCDTVGTFAGQPDNPQSPLAYRRGYSGNRIVQVHPDNLTHPAGGGN